MKKGIVLILLSFLLSKGYSQQSLSLSGDEKKQLMDMVVPVLQKCIGNFDGTYVPGTTIKKVNQASETKFEISGTCSYRGQQCGLISDTEYKVTIYQEGSQSFGETCILTPYCLFGVQTSKEWDCECRKWQYGMDNAAKGAAEIMRLLQAIESNQ